ncbi:MAG: hypothetical protein IJX06_03745 [Clostridia bacterium]|nr:hypothetical protein [Clostridia bacterium]
MKSVKELNKIADDASKSVMQTVGAIVDAQSFIESDKFIRSVTALGDAVGEGVVTGFATVNDAQVAVFAVNGEVLKGGVGKANATKIAKCVNNAVKTGAPLIGIVDSLGARFAEGIEAMEGYGAIINAFTLAYGNVPTILIIKGNNFGMLSYLTGLCDVTICCDKSVTATSSPLILAAGSTLDVAKVGTASVMSENGIASVVTTSDAELGATVKKVLSYFTDGIIASEDDGNRVCTGLGAGVDTATVISQVFDNGSFTELKKDYGKEVVTGFARLNGISVGVVAINANEKEGKICSDGAKKASAMVNTCDNFGIPVVTLVDCKGVVNCVKCQGELMRSVSDLLYSYNVSSVAKVSLITGNAIGLGYVAFASKSVFDYVIAWENATVGLLDNEASAQLVYADEIAKAENKEKASEELAKAYGEENTAAVTVAEKGYIDNVINPNFSRQYLIGAVQAFINKR